MLSLQNYTKFLNKEQTFFLKIFKISCNFLQLLLKIKGDFSTPSGRSK